ncbi:MAG: hypothetical protein CMF23_07905 [Ignavibacteriae bacterium]|nr:hypothetical protein [Ignavibacteriota bacterium]
MNLAIHCAGDITTVGVEKEEKIKFINLPSKYLFSNPNVFTDRLINILSDKLQILDNYPFENAVISVSGEIKGTRILLSDFLNKISLTDGFTGFDFGAALKNLSYNTFLINDIETYSHGIIKSGKLDTYSLLLVKDHFVGSSFIINDSFAVLDWNQFNSWGLGFNPNKHIGNILIDDILFDDIRNITEEYTDRFIDFIKLIIDKQKKNSINITNVIFLSEDIDLIDDKKLRLEYPEIIFYIDKLYKPNYSIQVNGCFTSLKQNNDDLNDSINKFFEGVLPLDNSFLQKAFDFISGKKIDQVVYCAEGGKELRKLNTSSEFFSHFNETKPFANPDNYYLFNFDDNQKLKVKLRHIDEENFLKKIKF